MGVTSPQSSDDGSSDGSQDREVDGLEEGWLHHHREGNEGWHVLRKGFSWIRAKLKVDRPTHGIVGAYFLLL